MAQAALDFLGTIRSERVSELILVTKHEAAPSDADEMLLLDVDLSILGAERSRFEQYEAQIRAEYEWVPEGAYRGARSKILGEFLARPELYHTEFFHRSLEARARENLRWSLDALAA